MMSFENEYTFRKITDADYKKAELDLLRDALKRSYKERFLFLMTLVRIQGTMQKMILRPHRCLAKKV